MEISTTASELALEQVNELALPATVACCLYLTVCRSVTALVRRAPHPRRRSRTSSSVKRSLSVLGLLIAVGAPASASGRGSVGRRSWTPAEQTIRPEPSGFPPPLSLGPAEPPPWEQSRDPEGKEPEVHRAIHFGGSAVGVRLFDRRSGKSEAEDARSVEATSRPREQRWHAVLPGETLWSIAAEVLQTNDIRRIARYWPRIHRANRDELGSNPDLVRPGQVLQLPPECR